MCDQFSVTEGIGGGALCRVGDLSLGDSCVDVGGVRAFSRPSSP